MLNLVNVTLEYPDGTGTIKALDNVNLKVRTGDIVSLAGPSGSGKSSLLAVGSTLIRPTSGLVVLDGTDTAALSDRDVTAPRHGGNRLPAAQPTGITDSRGTAADHGASARTPAP